MRAGGAAGGEHLRGRRKLSGACTGPASEGGLHRVEGNNKKTRLRWQMSPGGPWAGVPAEVLSGHQHCQQRGCQIKADGRRVVIFTRGHAGTEILPCGSLGREAGLLLLGTRACVPPKPVCVRSACGWAVGVIPNGGCVFLLNPASHSHPYPGCAGFQADCPYE